MSLNSLEVKISELEEQIARKNRQIQELELMHKISKEAAGVIHLNKSLQLIANEACDAFKAGIGSILLIDLELEELVIKAARGLDEAVIRETRVKVGERVSGWVAEFREPLLVVDIEKDQRFAKRSNEKYFNKSLIAAPIFCLGQFMGVININNKKTKEVFTEHDLDLLVAIAEQAGIIINNADNYKKLQNLYMDTVSALTEAIDTRDHYTKNHSEHVTQYAVDIARELGLSEERISILRDAAKLHDIGKIGVHDYILMKPGKLTNEEWEEIKLHALKGVKILQPLTFLNGSIDIIRSHHERYDGQGYPDGRKGEDIPFEARIMAVADSFDAMTTERPYRKALTTKEALDEIVREKGSQFDPDIADAFLRCVSKKNYSFSQESTDLKE
ncbi:MAG: HD domain-containing protein [Candidatus Omnitrophica bacterium]|nr:HD domain-containing protein [Candidatus Omnitrophota bacterium]